MRNNGWQRKVCVNNPKIIQCCVGYSPNKLTILLWRISNQDSYSIIQIITST